MGRKHPLQESLSENIGPPTKRFRFENAVLIPSTRNDSFNHQNEFGQPNFRIIRSVGGKRKKPNSSGMSTTTTDENDITELTRRFKKARIRPVFFTISTFVEQNVDDVQVTVGDDHEDEVHNAHAEVSSTFTFILPCPRNAFVTKDYKQL